MQRVQRDLRNRGAVPGRGRAVVSTELSLTRSDRLLVVAPHPDDESLGAGGLLMRAVAAGVAVRVVVVTDGDNNPWAQRVGELRWRIGPTDRVRFAAVRRREAEAALGHLGLPVGCAAFLGLPDYGLTDLLLRGDEADFAPLSLELERFAPTVVAGPSLTDLHPDHSALAVVLEMLLAAREAAGSLRLHARYVVHNRAVKGHANGGLRMPLDEDRVARKRAAIDCYATQRALRGSWLAGFATPAEPHFLDEPVPLRHPVRELSWRSGALDLELATRGRLRSFGPATLCVVAGGEGAFRAVVPLPPRSGEVEVRDARNGRHVGAASWQCGSRGGVLRLLVSSPALDDQVYVKLAHRHGFFDLAGWRKLNDASPAAAERIPAPAVAWRTRAASL